MEDELDKPFDDYTVYKDMVLKVENDKCKWTYLGEDDCFWETSCDRAFVFMDGNPELHGFTFCPYCGKKIEDEL